MTLLAATRLAEAKVIGGDGEPLGTLSELMLDTTSGAIVYAALAVGGVMGLGERLFAVPWRCFAVDGEGRVTSELTAAAFDGRDGFDKDAWPAEPDAAFGQG